MGPGTAGISPERRLPPYDPLILAVFISCHYYRITKSVIFFCIYQRGVTDIISPPHFETNQKSKYFHHFTDMETEENGAHASTPVPSKSALCLYQLSVGSSQFSPSLSSLFLCTLFLLSGAHSPLSARHHFLQHLVLHVLWSLPGPLLLPQLLIQPFISPLAFKTLAVMICMFYLLLLPGMFISARKIFSVVCQ